MAGAGAGFDVGAGFDKGAAGAGAGAGFDAGATGVGVGATDAGAGADGGAGGGDNGFARSPRVGVSSAGSVARTLDAAWARPEICAVKNGAASKQADRLQTAAKVRTFRLMLGAYQTDRVRLRSRP